MITNAPVSISREYNYALDRMEHSRDSLFVTGRAGTGKSTLLGLFRDTTKKRCVFLAPTGVAALHIRGQTIHSFFGLPPKFITKQELTKRKNHRLYKKVDCIVIDEISMVRVDLIDAIDTFLQLNRENSLPFGGVQMIFFGDLYQLPPVIASAFERKYLREHYPSQYFFSAQVMNRLEPRMEMIELHEVHRQKDKAFIRLLDSIRTRTFDLDDLEGLNNRVMTPDTLMPEEYITLATRNAVVDRINSSKMAELTSPEFLFVCKVQGQFTERNPPAPPNLRLRKGAQVMFVKNDQEKRFVNGTLGTVESVENDRISVRLVDEYSGEQKTIDVEKSTWEIIKYRFSEKNDKEIEAHVIGTFEQYPLILAWAVTIHKSQGKTFSNALIDLTGGAFDYGQTYVALSRCKTLDGIFLKSPIRPKDVMVDERIVDYYLSQSR